VKVTAPEMTAAAITKRSIMVPPLATASLTDVGMINDNYKDVG
jgi:hypothetical protein